ncbi:hypothetical protein [Collinsella sp. AF20-14LB]|uniref:hypothetical protein n=1 Tax=Collinsella sp. AF20-14LB TaxID=2292221 RepID=UPI000E47360D|nr:hypothetical protein [Collinsella sp. AF20-14LB]RGS92832.1 hypothetical protein DWX63_04995 [Collinsella sp. AF20-14LB]
MKKDKNEQNEIARPVGKHFAQADDSRAKSRLAESAAPASKARKRLWAVAVLLCAVAIVTGTYLTYTAFLAGDFLKSVAVSGTSRALFASDMLTGYTSENLNDGEIAVRSVIADTSGENCSFTFRIYNHLLGDKNKVNDKDVNATLSVRATGTTGTWSVNGTPALATDGTVNLSFPANKATMYTYTVTFAQADLNKASFTVKAQVGPNSPGTNLKWLAAKIAPAERAEVAASGVSGEWVDKSDSIGNFDAYNYRVTVTGAPTKVELTWGDKVELDPFFETNHSDAIVNKNKRAVTFTMEPGSEIITFYRATDTAPGNWGDDIGVTCGSA